MSCYLILIKGNIVKLRKCEIYWSVIEIWLWIMFEIFNKTHDTMNTALGVLDSLFIRYFKPLKIKSNHVEKTFHGLWFADRKLWFCVVMKRVVHCVGGGGDNKWK